MTRQECTQLLQSCSAELRERFGVRRLVLFGSVARGEQTATSDVDVCVDMQPKMRLFVELGIYLEQTLGCPVDVVRRHRNMNVVLQREIEKDGIYVFG